MTRAWRQGSAHPPVWLAAPGKLGRLRTTAALVGIALSGRGFTSPWPPSRALGAFQHDAGLRVELVAAEPVWSKISCGLPVVEIQQSTQAFTFEDLSG